MLCAEPWSKCCKGNLFLKRIYQAIDDKEADKARGSFLTDDAAMNLIYRAISSFEKTRRAVIEWAFALWTIWMLFSPVIRPAIGFN